MAKNKLKIKTEWDLTPLLKSDDEPKQIDFLEEAKQANYKFINKWKDRDDYLINPKILKEALDEFEELLNKCDISGGVGYYFSMRQALEQDNKDLKAKINKLTDFETKIDNDRDFFTHRISKIPVDEQRKFLEDPDLQIYRHALESIFDNAKYLLSEDEEKILNLMSPMAHSNWTRMVSTFISKEEAELVDEEGNKKIRTFSEISSLLNSQNKHVRDEAANAMNKIFVKHLEVAENEMNSVLQSKKVNDELRKMERPDLGRYLGDDIEPEIVDTLIQSVSERFNISRDYYRLKANLMGLAKLEYHERNVEYGSITKKYPYEEAVELVYEVFTDLDSEFAEIFKGFVEKGSIDAFPKKGKRGGAFCTHNLPHEPVYILLNHTDLLDNVLTIAHEVGHGIHNTLFLRKQNALVSGAALSTAEVASTYMEDFVLDKLMQEADDELKLSLMMMKLNSDISTILRQISCVRFEQELHRDFREKGYLSHQEIGALFQKHMAAYMGDYVEQSEGAQNWWVYWSHIRSFFYNYSYANGLLISKALQNETKKDKQFTNKVKEFMSAGTSKSTKQIFADIGIDITNKMFWHKGLDEVAKLLQETEALAKKLGKI